MDPITAQQLAEQQQNAAGGFGMFGMVYMLFWLAFGILTLVGLWRVFTKAGEPGWKCIIPFYNIWTMWKIVGRPGWWLIWFFIPFVNFVMAIWLYYDLSKSFGHGWGFTLGLVFLAPIFTIILGFGSSQYEGPWAQHLHAPTQASGGTPMTPTPA